MAIKIETFIGQLEAKWAEGKYVCVGLDPDINKTPEPYCSQNRNRPVEGMYRHLTEIVEQTRDIIACYKPNIAFFESYGWRGIKMLEELLIFIADEAPDIPVILDAKRGDIGNTNEHYAKMAFDYLGADAITIHPYLGWEANKPFLDRADKGIIVLCRTSNPGAGEFQDIFVPVPPEIFEDLHGFYGTDEAIDIIASLKTDWSDMMMPFYQRVAHHVTYNWNQNGNCCLVTGGTYPSEIAEIRKIAPNIPLLIPGIGKQGGDLEGSVHAARHRFVINSSSGVIFADDPRAEALKLHNQIQEALATIA